MTTPQHQERDILPTNVKPVHYDVTLNLDVNDVNYSGRVSIELDVLESTEAITLHSVNLDIKNVSIEDAAGKKIEEGLDVSYNKDKQTATIELPNALTSGAKASLGLEFNGTLRDGMSGLFRRKWEDQNGDTKYQITSQFEAVDARSAIPCFDEPLLKASFTLTIVADKELTCLANMPVASTKDTDGGKAAVTFEKTPKMSTYILAFAVGELNMIETNSFRVPVRLYAYPKADIEMGRWALEVAAKTLTFFEERLGVPLPLPKTDLIVVPDFLGAMENWGLITFRENMLIFDPKTGTIAQKRLIGDVVMHELAHQWFGNLVTMDWWNGLWLNEGFATWASMYAMDSLFPEWNMRQEFLYQHVREAFDLDSLRNSHPIEAPVNTADDIGQIFDAVSYSKGCTVIRMLAAYMGEEVFIKGIQKYLEKHQYGSTTTEDLWFSLSASSGLDIATIMGPWTLNVGHPVVQVTNGPEERKLHLKQNRFLRSGDVKPEEDQTLFPITLKIRTKDGKVKEMIHNTREMDVSLDSDLVKVNAGHIGFFRTAYSPEALGHLGEQLSTLSVEDRFGVISDAMSLASAGYQKTSDVLTLLQQYRNESNLTVWREVTAAITTVRIAWMFEDDTVQEALRKLEIHLVRGKIQELGWDLSQSKDEEETALKALLFKSAAMSGEEKAKDAAFRMFQQYKDGDRSAIHSDIKEAVFATVIKYSKGTDEFDAVVNEFKIAKSMEERAAALNALGEAQQPELMQQALDMMLTDDVKKQETFAALRSYSQHRGGVEASWEWLKKNYEQLKQKLDSGLDVFGWVVAACSENFSSEEAANDIENFWKTKDTKSFSSGVAQSLDSIRVKARWVNSDRQDVREWLEESRG